MIEDDEARPLGPAAILGAARGALAGGMAAFGVMLPFVVFSHGVQVEALGIVCGGVAFGGAVFSSGNAVAARLRGQLLERFVLFLAGTLAPVVCFFPFVGVSNAMGQGAPLASDLLPLIGFFGAVGVGLGIGLAASGAPHAARSWRDEVRRGFDFMTMTLAVLLIPLVALTACGGPIVFALVGYPAAILYALAFVVAKTLTRPLAAWLEPGASGPDLVLREQQRAALVARCELEVRAARVATPDERPAKLALALEAARMALEVGRGPRPRPHGRFDDVRRLVALILEVGSEHDLELLARELPDLDAIRGELKRSQGDPRGAEEIARAVLARASHRALVRANAHGVLTLALADQGRFHEAAAEMSSAALAQKIVPPSSERLDLSRLREHVERCQAAARAPLQPRRVS